MTRWIRQTLRGLRALVRRRDERRDLDDELREYLAESVDAKVAAGLDPADALRAARAELGSPAAIHDYVQDVGWESRLLNVWDDVRYAARGLKASPGFTLAVLATLGLGIGVNTAMFSMLDAVVLRKLSVPAAEELFALYENAPRAVPDPVSGSGRYLRFSYPRYTRLEQALGTHGSLAATTGTNRFSARLQDGQRITVDLQLVSGNYFETLRVQSVRGRVLTTVDTTENAPAVAVVSDGFWKRQLSGADDAIGRTLEINKVIVTVVGVAPSGFGGVWLDDSPDLWLPVTQQPVIQHRTNTSTYGAVDATRSFLDQDRIAWLNLVGRARRDERRLAETLLQTENRLALADFAEGAAENARERESMQGHTLALEPLSHGFSRLRARQSTTLLALTGLLSLILLLTAANVANLMLVRASRRRRETAVRVALGATTSRIVTFVLVEALLLAGLGGAAGVLAAGWSRHVLAKQLVGTSSILPAGFSLDPRTVLFAIAASGITAIVFGVAPAFRAARAGSLVSAGLNERETTGLAALRGMRPFVVLQLALSVVIVFAATLLSRSLLNLVRVDTGFAAEHLVTASFFNVRALAGAGLNPTPLGDRLVTAANGVPGVASSAVSVCGLIAGCSYTSSVRIDRVDGTVSVYQNWVGPGYFATVGMRLLRGREFDERDTDHSMPVVVITESIARRYFPGRDPIGTTLRGLAASQQYDAEIVGVVADVRPVSLRADPVAMVFYPYSLRRTDAFPTAIDIRVAGDPAGAVGGVRDALTRAEPELTFNVTSMPMRLAQHIERDRAVAYLTSAFAGLALLLASVGLYGVLSYLVGQRSREIGVRLALGAQRSDVIALVVKQGTALAIIGLAIGLAVAPSATRSLQGMFFEVSPLDMQMFVSVSILMLAVAALATIVPARRATRVDPIVALRCE
jgi:predicted permease